MIYYLCRFNEKIEHLKEFGLIGYWIEMEQDKVARLAKLGNEFYEFQKKTFFSVQDLPLLVLRV